MCNGYLGKQTLQLPTPQLLLLPPRFLLLSTSYGVEYLSGQLESDVPSQTLVHPQATQREGLNTM